MGQKRLPQLPHNGVATSDDSFFEDRFGLKRQISSESSKHVVEESVPSTNFTPVTQGSSSRVTPVNYGVYVPTLRA